MAGSHCSPFTPSLPQSPAPWGVPPKPWWRGQAPTLTLGPYHSYSRLPWFAVVEGAVAPLTVAFKPLPTTANHRQRSSTPV